MKIFFKPYSQQIKIGLICGLLMLSMFLGMWFGQSSHFPSVLRKIFLFGTQNSSGQISPEQVIIDVAKIIDVPLDEVPTIATVSDISKLAGQPFFAKAEEGDKVLLYPVAQKAILYRPSSHKVMEASSLKSVLDTSSAQVP